MVATTCCASTARQTAQRSGAASEATARGVQVGDDTNQPFDGAQELVRRPAEREIGTREPLACRVLVAPQRIERPEHPHEEQCQLPLLGAVGGEQVFAAEETRSRGFGN